MKLKLIPMVLALVVSASLLFGGWFVYHSVAMENPLNEALAGSAGVDNTNVKLSGDKTLFDVTLNSKANLREIVHELEAKNTQIAGKRKADIRVTSNTSPELEQWWSQALFQVAQAMETSQYADIPANLQAKAASLDGLNVQTEMDEANVYVKLTAGEHAKFVILPRNAAKLGAWSND